MTPRQRALACRRRLIGRMDRFVDEVAAAIQSAVQEEREACLKLADRIRDESFVEICRVGARVAKRPRSQAIRKELHQEVGLGDGAHRVAEAIRARP